MSNDSVSKPATASYLTEHSGLREFQNFHKWLDQEKKFTPDMFINIAFLTEELGEVVKATRIFQKADTSELMERARGQIGEELADCLAYILKLANYSDIDLYKAYVNKMKQNMHRTWHQQTD
ncbi:MAG: MazG nucleotide pyrophosphohydrolase domain-containing protein [Pseudomonadota bacterium]